VTTPDTVPLEIVSETSAEPLANCATVSRSNQVCAATNENITTMPPMVRNLGAGTKCTRRFRCWGDQADWEDTYRQWHWVAGIMNCYDQSVFSVSGPAGNPPTHNRRRGALDRGVRAD